MVYIDINVNIIYINHYYNLKLIGVINGSRKRCKKVSIRINIDAIFDLNLSEEEYAEKLEELLIENNMGVVERRKILRQKVQEFIEKKRPKGKL